MCAEKVLEDFMSLILCSSGTVSGYVRGKIDFQSRSYVILF